MRIEVKGETPEPIVDVSTPEAAAEFKRKRDGGFWGARNEAERQETLRISALYEKYEDEMTREEFWNKIASGEIKVPEPHTWKQKRQFWFDKESSEYERTVYGDRCPRFFRHAILLWQRSDGTMWYQSAQFWNVVDGPSPPIIAVSKMTSAVVSINRFLTSPDAEESVDDETFLVECERSRELHKGTYFEIEDVGSVVAGLREG